MGEEKISQTARDMLYLAACALQGEAPAEAQLSGMDLAGLYRLAKNHAMTAIVCMALESCQAFSGAEPDLVKRWKDEKNKAIRKNMLLDAECREILEYMKAEGIWHMPLKGAVLKDLYPKYGMRQMADYDILFDPSASGKMRSYMINRGYRAENFGKGSHDAYHKPPVYNFELHRSLFSPPHNPVWCRYYAEVKERLIPAGDNVFRFRDEDFYIYITVHAYKHYAGGGTGLRTLLDCYVYCRKKGAFLDWDYIRTESNILGIAKFEQEYRELSERLFAQPASGAVDSLTKEQREMLSYLIHSGIYGTEEQRVKNKLRSMQSDGKPVSKKTRLRYFWDRLFPDREWLRANAPFCYRHKWIIPFYLVFRVIRGLLFRRGKISREIRAVKKSDS